MILYDDSQRYCQTSIIGNIKSIWHFQLMYACYILIFIRPIIIIIIIIMKLLLLLH